MPNNKLTDGRRIEIINEATRAWGRKDNDVLYLAVCKAIENEVLCPVEQHEAAPADGADDQDEAAERAYFKRWENAPSAPLEGTGNGAKTCKTCGGSRVVDDGEITGSGGVEFENGPIRCVKDCPDCTDRAPRTEVAGAVPYGWKLMPPKMTPAMRMAFAEAAAEYMKRTGGNNPDVMYKAAFDAASQPPSADAAAEDKYVIERLSTVLAGVASALLGEEADRPAAETLQKLPEEAAKLRLELDLYRAQAADAAAAPADAQAVEAVDYDRVVSICDAHGIGLPVDCIELVVDIVRHAAPPPPAPASATVGMTDALREAREELSLVEWENDPPARVTDLFSKIDTLLEGAKQ